jgi:influenza virus NS1A-binding protein
VVAFKGGLMVVGGADSWNCINLVEMYQPATNTWAYIANLSTVRRGAGIDVVGGEAFFFLVVVP